MSSGTILAPPSRVSPAPSPVSAGTLAGDGDGEAAEINRWALLLGIPFVLSALFFMAMLATGDAWLIAGSLATGPGLLIASVIYLSLSSDANSG